MYPHTLCLLLHFKGQTKIVSINNIYNILMINVILVCLNAFNVLQVSYFNLKMPSLLLKNIGSGT
jgi:hypothetical protein